MKLKFLFASLMTFFLVSEAQAVVDNQIGVVLTSSIARSCLIDLAPAASPQQSSVSMDFPITRGPRDLMDTSFISVTVYETCNEDFAINIKSLNGGLKHDGSNFVKVYYFNYPGNAALEYSTSADSHSQSLRLLKTISGWQAEDPINRPDGTTPFFQPRTLTLATFKDADLPKGSYSDVLSLEMATPD